MRRRLQRHRLRRLRRRLRVLRHLTADRQASACLRRRSPATWLALRVLCPPAGFRTFTRVYAYFRWADDIVDAPGRDPRRVADFVVSQAALVEGRRPPAEAPEQALRAALDGDPALLPVVTGMWEALAFDAARGPDPLAPAELARQVARVGDAYLDAMWTCSGAPGRPTPGLYALSRAATLTHILRDLAVDLALGYVNLPPEVPPENAAAVATWVRARANEADALFAEGARALREVGPGRARWLLGIFAWRYRRVLAAVRRRYGG